MKRRGFLAQCLAAPLALLGVRQDSREELDSYLLDEAVRLHAEHIRMHVALQLRESPIIFTERSIYRLSDGEKLDLRPGPIIGSSAWPESLP